MNRPSQSATATAHRYWDKAWQDDAKRSEWSAPEPDVVACVTRLAAGERPVAGLDVGSGIGRHTLAMAEAGLSATGLDASPAGLAELALEAKARGLDIATVEGNMLDLPFADASFDYVLSFNVIYHGTRQEVARAVSEIRRVLVAGGTFQGTLLSRRNVACGQGTEIEPGVFVMPPEPGSDKDHPHYYCNARELVDLLEGFELVELKDEEQYKAGSWHWRFIATRI